MVVGTRQCPLVSTPISVNLGCNLDCKRLALNPFSCSLLLEEYAPWAIPLLRTPFGLLPILGAGEPDHFSPLPSLGACHYQQIMTPDAYRDTDPHSLPLLRTPFGLLPSGEKGSSESPLPTWERV